MLKYFLLLLVTLAGLLISSCHQEDKQPLSNPTQMEKYFPINDFVLDQIPRVSGLKVKKKVVLRDKEVITVEKLDSLDWRKELDIFIQADINKSALALSYRTTEKNGKTIHTLLPGEKGNIQWMEISQSDNFIREIRFFSKRENLFYFSTSEGTLQMDSKSGRLSSYFVNGSQKVWFLPTNNMEINGQVIF